MKATPFLIAGALLATALIGTVAFPARATHYRYGHLTWRPRLDLGPRTVEFTLIIALRRSAYFGSGEDHRPEVGNIITDTIGATKLRFGDGSETEVLRMRVSAVDRRQDYIYGFMFSRDRPQLSTIRHTYTSDGAYAAFVDGCCRVTRCSTRGTDLGSSHINNFAGDYRLETTVTVGNGNISPTSTLFPIIACRRNEVCSFQIPAGDLDGDTIRFRFATPFEAATDGEFVQPGQPGSGSPRPATITPDGLFSWDTTGAAQSGMPECPRTLYSTQIIMEDLDPGGNPKTKVPLDFFLLLGGIETPPQFVFPTPPCDRNIFGTPRNRIQFTVRAGDVDPNDVITLNAVGLPSGATMTPPLPITGGPGEPVESMFRWTPINSQVGRFVVTFAATDRTNQATCTLPLEVSTCNDDDFGNPRSVTFDVDPGGMALPAGTNVGGNTLQDQGVRMAGFSGVNGNPGVFTNRTGPPGTDTDDLIPQTGLNFITTLADPGNMTDSEHGTVIFDFVDPVSHLRRNIELAELYFLDVEDSVARLTAYSDPGGTGTVLDSATTQNNLSGSQVRLQVGRRFGGFTIGSIRADFGDNNDSAALDSLCFEFHPGRVGITDDMDDSLATGIRPGDDMVMNLSIVNREAERFVGTFVVVAVMNSDDPYHRRVRIVSTENFNIAGDATLERQVSYRVPMAWGMRNLGRNLQIGHYLCDRDLVVEEGTVATYQILAENR